MKLNSFILLIAIMFTAFSCSDKSPTDESEEITNIISAKFDGEYFESKPEYTFATLGEIGNKKKLIISGAKEFSLEATNIQIFLTHPTSVKPESGTYQNNAENPCNFQEDICPKAQYVNYISEQICISGNSQNDMLSMSISSIDYVLGGHIIGTFSGQVGCGDIAIVQITEGKFNLMIDE